MTQQRFDAVIIGSGINALVAGAMLAKGGWTVALIERNRVPGGAIATTTAMFDGYTVEQLSSWHPLFVGGPAYGALSGDLAARGVVYQNTDSPTGVVCADGTAVLSTDAAATAEQLHALGDGPAWEQMIGDFAAKADLAFGVLGTDFWRSSAMKFGWKAWRALGTRGLVGQGAEMLEPAAPWLERTFTSPVTHALLAPWALHNGLGPDDASSAFITKVIAAAIAWGGMPVPVGGGVTVVDALIGIITDAGGALMTDSTVERIEVTEGTARAVHLSNGSVIAARKAIVTWCRRQRRRPLMRFAMAAPRCRFTLPWTHRRPGWAMTVLRARPWSMCWTRWDRCLNRSMLPGAACCRPGQRSWWANQPRSMPLACQRARDCCGFSCRKIPDTCAGTWPG